LRSLKSQAWFNNALKVCFALNLILNTLVADELGLIVILTQAILIAPQTFTGVISQGILAFVLVPKVVFLAI
jgi:hypothetical protein